MKRRSAPLLFAAALALAFGASCASEPDSAWGTFAGAWEDAWHDSEELISTEFLGSDRDDPYARPNGWTWQGADSDRMASRLFLDSGDTSGERIERSNPRREESSVRSFFHWILDVD